MNIKAAARLGFCHKDHETAAMKHNTQMCVGVVGKWLRRKRKEEYLGTEKTVIKLALARSTEVLCINTHRKLLEVAHG